MTSGDWALRVYSADTLGDDYTVNMNATNPPNAVTVYSTSASLHYAVLGYENGNILLNGSHIANKEENNLNWEREYYFSYDRNYNQRTHEISDVKIQGISSPVRYSSNYARSDKALLIQLDEGTLFTYHYSAFRSGPPTQRVSTYVDTLGKTTPRRLDAEDLMIDNHILVYDLITQKTIDFLSILNYYYANGIEPESNITELE